MCGQKIVEQKLECNVWSKHSRTQSRVQYVVETETNKKSSRMCGRNIVEQKVKCKVWSKHKRTKSRVQCVVET